MTSKLSDQPRAESFYDMKAFKDCNQDGTWWRHPETNKSWSNYTTCIDLENLNENRVNVQLYIAGYSCSLAAISIALFIFFYFRQLQCTRITIHKNLFASFILTNTAWIVWYTEVNTVISVLTTNPVWCQVLHVVNQYFMSCNYLWMFCEGMYLHTMIVFAFVTEKHIMKLLALVGWGFPALLAIVYGAVRGTMPDGDLENCWIKESRYMWIITAPLCLSIVVRKRKAVRAVLILIPLLGVYYIIMWVPPGEGSNAQVVYQKLLAIFSSFQGFFVALIFCFLNGEVLGLIKKKWYNYQEVHGRGRRFSTYNTTMTEVGCSCCSCVGSLAQADKVTPRAYSCS
ncbi:PREDICTED: calcitonin gene-related peptide type 1 receptor-like [Priapulus caudatus]|uniref:Calcitonin gene-related peptide type 1 receptor-like n=1 Tax=Priapulus caudatus TaxID=37621 RepID=A0ABM1DNB7_PRICU|nr:PREDICTED: calcitonin gene-related peptide type 1 receptor-like [Priapulus caudatus]